MNDNPLLVLRSFGQSVWLDTISRDLIRSGKLKRLIDEEGLRGVTSNPAIFANAIEESRDYDDSIRALAPEGKTYEEIYEAVTVEDVCEAADLLRPTYDKLDGADGFVSIEVNPHLAHDAEGTIAEARRLWAELDRPNVFIKVPATVEGLTAIRRLISEGVNVNVTLLFGLSRYRKVAEAYIEGLEDRVAMGQPIDRVASVASFFLSRIDVLVDPMLDKIIQAGGERAGIAGSLRGQIAVASAKVAYSMYKEIFSLDRFRALTADSARAQRLLWASTGTKSREYSKVKYVEPLIGANTVNTMPLETLKAYRDRGRPAPRIEEDLVTSVGYLRSLTDLGIELDKVTRQLEDEGIDKFIKPYDSLMCSLEGKRLAAPGAPGERGRPDRGPYARAV